MVGRGEEDQDASIKPPPEVDLMYNVVVCTECCTGLAFDYSISQAI